MVKSLVSGLLAAAAVIVPAIATAQDGRGREAFQVRADARARMEARGDGQRGGWQRPAERAQVEAQARVEAPAPRPQFQPRQERSGGWQRPERAAPPAAAQVDAGAQARFRGDRGQGDRGQGDRGQWQGRRGGDRPAGVFNGEAQARAAADAQARARRGDDRRNDARRWDNRGQQQWNRGGWDRSRADWRDNARAGFRFDDRRAWNRGWRTDNRYDWTRYRTQNRSAYHLPRYYAPYGWNGGYRRFSVGVTLSSPLWTQDYWIDDPYAYRLPDAYGPYRWVRYYNDALLVDTYSGQVVDVIYDIFW